MTPDDLAVAASLRTMASESDEAVRRRVARLRLALSWCYPQLVAALEEAVREDERRRQVQRCRPS